MKKKYLFIGIIVLCVIGIALTTILLLTNTCNKDKKPEEVVTWKENMTEIVSIKTETIMKDSGVIVYKYVKNLEYESGENANIVTETSTLNSSFELDTTYSKEQKVIKKENTLAINLDRNLYLTFNSSENVIMGTVNNENINKVLNTSGLEIKDFATIMITFNENKLNTIVCNYKTSTNKDVTMTVVYGY